MCLRIAERFVLSYNETRDVEHLRSALNVHNNIKLYAVLRQKKLPKSGE